MIQQGQNTIPPDTESVYQSLTTLQTSNPQGYQAIVRTGNPPPGIGGYLFDIPGDEEVRLRSQITNYFLEDNTSVQDNIALEPPTITLRGMVAELVLGTVKAPPVAQAANPLPTQPSLLPGMTPAQQEAYTSQQEASQQQATAGSDAAAASGTSQSLFTYYDGTVSAGSAITRQTNAFLYFRELWAGRQLVSVETPWGIWQNCAILEVRPVQDAKTRGMTDFTITFQEMRFAGEATVQAGQLAGRTALQMAPQSQDGNAGQTPAAPTSWLAQIFGPPNG